ncbi:hypothetical protein M885DRAFT_613207 [Pelagophyceae sp. CCMP2097]|nr:hypothetical protein M885DRAFT_613207 [Pelagophyceae sp. CCMP2097]
MAAAGRPAPRRGAVRAPVRRRGGRGGAAWALCARWALCAALLSRGAEAACSGAQLTSFSGLLDSSQYMTTPLSAGDQCEFRIAPKTDAGAAVDWVYLVFETLAVPTAELQVYEGAAGFAQLKWSCLRCGSQVPPPIKCAVSCVINFRSPNGLSASFSLRYVSSADLMAGNYLLNLRMGQALIEAPQMSTGAMPRGLRYTWVLEPEQCASNACDLILMIEAVVLAPGDALTLTYLQGSDVLAAFDSNSANAATTTWYAAKGNSLVVRLTTLSSPTMSPGLFRARFFADAPNCNEGTYCDCGAAGAAGVIPLLRGATEMLSDGTSSNAAMVIDMCEWIIKPAQLDFPVAANYFAWPPPQHFSWQPKLTLILDRVSIKRTGVVRVYDGSSATAKLLWDCIGCSDVAPPPLEASGNALFIAYESDTNSAYYQDPNNPIEQLEWTGWHASYWTDGFSGARGVGSSEVLLLAGSADSVRAPFDGSTAGSYARGLDYTWVVSPPMAAESNVLRLAFSRLSLRCGDLLRVSSASGALLKTYDCAASDPPAAWVVASAAGLVVHLTTTTDAKAKPAGHAGAFLDFAYFSDAEKYKCGHVREPGLLALGSFVFSDGSAPSDNMGANADCAWLLAPTPASGAVLVESVTLVLTRVDLSGGVLEVRDGSTATAPLLWRCDGCQLVPPPIASSGAALYVRLTSSSAGSDFGTGFDARYYSSFANSTGIGDRVVPLFAAAVPSFVSPKAQGRILAHLDQVWTIDVGGTFERVTLAVASVDVGTADARGGCGADRLTVYDGAGVLNTNVLRVLCGTVKPRDWVVSSGPTLTLRLETGPNPTGAGFEASYFSARAQQGCGGVLRPRTSPSDNLGDWWQVSDLTTRQVLRAPSFVFSDGAAEAAKMRLGADCEWLISPAADEGVAQIVLAFPRLNLGGAGSLNITDAETGRSLFACDAFYGGCAEPPPTLVLGCAALTKCALRVRYATATSGAVGPGFLAHYFVATTPAPSKPAAAQVLLQQLAAEDQFLDAPLSGEAPRDIRALWSLRPALDTAADWQDADSWRVSLVTDAGGSLILSHGLTPEGEAVAIVDGNDAAPQAWLATRLPRQCGALSGDLKSGEARRIVSKRAGLREVAVSSRVDAETARLLFRTNAAAGHEVSFYGGVDSFYDGVEADSKILGSTRCAWAVDAPTGAAAETASFVLAQTLQLAPHATLAIYAGSSHLGERLFHCTGCLVPETGLGCCKNAGATLASARCGKLFVSLDLNVTTLELARLAILDPLNGTAVAFVAALGAQRPTMRAGSDLCVDDVGYVAPRAKAVPEDLPVAAVVALVLGALLCLLSFCLGLRLVLSRRRDRRRQHASSLLYGGLGPAKGAMHRAPRLSHARFYGRWVFRAWNAIALRKGECAICYADDSVVLGLLGCGHRICVECLRRYAQAALGDISMFPLRCPMHHNGCKSNITDALARRVLTGAEYRKFNDFVDRCVLGDGLHCLKCGCFVNLPPDAAEPLVQCPYCAYRWCVKCKCPWHPNVQCDERADIELEEWRELHGAQNCPGCFKIIEKDDSETCNHMVHKLSDALPCVRERTDFCYCCGCEVLPDYPHCEADDPEVSHFPDGVFQDCRAVKMGYATMMQKRGRGGARRARRRDDDDDLTEVIGANAFGNYFQNAAFADRRTPPRVHITNQVYPTEHAADQLGAADRRRRRREDRENATRARRTNVDAPGHPSDVALTDVTPTNRDRGRRTEMRSPAAADRANDRRSSSPNARRERRSPTHMRSPTNPRQGHTPTRRGSSEPRRERRSQTS